MSLSAFLPRIYQILLWLYPPGFRSEYGEEMLDVFTQRIEDARLQGKTSLLAMILRELINLPDILIKLYGSEWETSISHTTIEMNSPSCSAVYARSGGFDESPLLSILLAVFPFLPFSISVVTYRHLRLDYAVTAWLGYITLFLVLIGIMVGWIKGFPRWSYPYTGLGLMFITMLLLGSDSDMNTWENLLFKLIVLTPIALVFALVGWFTHGSHPVRRLVHNIRSDWTLVPFAVYSALVPVISVIFNNIRSTYGAPFLAAATLSAVGGVVLYLRLPQPGRRFSALAAAMTLVWWISTLASATFWHDRPLWNAPGYGNGYQIAAEYAGYWALMLVLMLLPLIVRRVWHIYKKA